MSFHAFFMLKSVVFASFDAACQSKAASFYFGTEKNLKSELWYFCGKQTNKIQIFEILCVLTHARFEILEFSLSVFHRNITILISNFFQFQNRNLLRSIDILITYKYFLILAAELVNIKFLKSRKKPTLSDVLDFASLYVNLILELIF